MIEECIALREENERLRTALKILVARCEINLSGALELSPADWVHETRFLIDVGTHALRYCHSK